MTQRTLPEIAKDLAGATKRANIDMDTVPAKMQSAFIVAKNDGKAALERLGKEYQGVLLQSAEALFPFGGPQNVASFATEAGRRGAIVVDASEHYNVMAKKIAPSIGHSKEFGVNQVSLLNAPLRSLAQSYGYTKGIPTLRLASTRIVNSVKEIAAYVRKLVQMEMGDFLVTSFVMKSVIDEALKAGYQGDAISVVILNATDEERASLGALFSKSIPVDTDAAASTKSAQAQKDEDEALAALTAEHDKEQEQNEENEGAAAADLSAISPEVAAAVANLNAAPEVTPEVTPEVADETAPTTKIQTKQKASNKAANNKSNNSPKNEEK